MAYLNVKERMLEAKIVYYGPGLGGKTTNLEQIKAHAAGGRTGELMSLSTDGDRTLFFDWLPFNMGRINGCDVKVQLYTVPGQAKYAETRKRVLAHADGVVLVLDSQSGAIDRNIQTVSDLHEHMAANKLSPERVPILVQLNKRDLPTAMAPAELLSAVGLSDAPFVEAVASTGQGVFETLRDITQLVLQAVRATARSDAGSIESGAASGLDGETLFADIVALLPEAAATAIARRSGGVRGHGAQPRPAAPAVGLPTTPRAQPLPASVDSTATLTSPVVVGVVGVVGGVGGVGTAATAPRSSPVTREPPPAARPAEVVVATRAVTAPPAVRIVSEPVEPAPSSGQLGEIVAGQRALLKRLEVLERALQQSIADMERKVSRPAEKASGPQPAEPRLDRVLAQLDAIEARLGGLAGAVAMAAPVAEIQSLEATLRGAITGAMGAGLRTIDGRLAELSRDRATASDLRQLQLGVSQSIGEAGAAGAAAFERGLTDLRASQPGAVDLERSLRAALADIAEDLWARFTVLEAERWKRAGAESEDRSPLAEAIARGLTEITKLSQEGREAAQRLDERVGGVDSSTKDAWVNAHNHLKLIDSKLAQVVQNVSEIHADWRSSKKSWWRG